MPCECLSIIESKSKVHYSRNKPVVAQVNTNTSTSGISPDVAELKDMVKVLLLDKKSQSPAPVKAVEESCVVENEPEATKDTVNPTNNRSTEDVQPQVVQSEYLVLSSEAVTSLISEPVISSVSAPMPNPKSSIPYPSRRNDERNHEKANNQIGKFYQIFKDMSFEISFVDALILMTKFASTLKALIRNKKKLSEMARTSLNEHCFVVLLKKLPEKLGDPGKFLIPCDFLSMAECLALADLGASINLMPFSVWKRLSLPDLTPTCMTLELADHSISRLVGVTEDVYVKVGSFHFLTDFIVVDFDADARLPLIHFLKTERALIDVFKEYSQEGTGFFDVISSGNPTSYYDPIVSTTSPNLTPFENSDFLLEEVDAFLKDDPTLPKVFHPKPVTSLISEPKITPVSASRPNPQSSIPYPSMRNDENNRKRAKDQIEKFYQIFKDMSFEISFADALMLMPKFASTLKALIENKEKLSEMARTLLNEHCSAVLLKKLLEKLGDPCKFLIPCDFPGMAECLALADLDASINLMSYYVWKRLSLSDLTPTCMTLKLADRLITSPVGIAEDVYVKVGSFHFPADFVVVDFDADPRVPLIIRRSFLKTEKALIDIFEVDEPHVAELKELPPHLEYAFLEGDDKLPVIIAKYLSVEEKTALITILKSHKRAIA
nr:reverse transcriptase domain-containing protein [Tanacetum cinerariifolium]